MNLSAGDLQKAEGQDKKKRDQLIRLDPSLKKGSHRTPVGDGARNGGDLILCGGEAFSPLLPNGYS